MQRIKILITGSNGLTGQSLIRESSKFPEIKIIATSRSSNRIEGLETFELLDITRPENINYLLDLYQPDCIINTAAISQIDTCEQNHNTCYETNFLAVTYLAEACKKRNIHFIHMSTDFVFNGQFGMYSEEDSPEPINYYGKTKLLAEEYLQNSEVKNSIVRTVLIYDYHKIYGRSNIFQWIYNSLSEGKKIKVVNDQYRTPTFVDDLSIAILKIAIGKHEGIWHISGKDYLSVYDFAVLIAKKFDFNTNLIEGVHSIELNEIAQRPAKTGFNIHKAMIELNYNPHNIQQAFDVIKKMTH